MQKRKTVKERGRRRIILDLPEEAWAKVAIAAKQSYSNMTTYCTIAINVALMRDLPTVTNAEIENMLRKPRIYRVK